MLVNSKKIKGLPSMLKSSSSASKDGRRTKIFLKNALIERNKRRDQLKNIRGDGLLNLHDEMNGNRGVDGMEEERKRGLRELLLEERERGRGEREDAREIVERRGDGIKTLLFMRCID